MNSLRLVLTAVVLVSSGLPAPTTASDHDNLAPGAPSFELPTSGEISGARVVPSVLAFQGYLTDDLGTPVDGTVGLDVGIYTDSGGGTAVWMESHAAVGVGQGVFSIELGSINPIPASIFSGATLYLGISVDGAPELTPRTPLQSSPYAFRAFDADNLGGVGADGYVERAGDDMSGPLGLQGGVVGLTSGALSEIVDSETDVTLRHFYYDFASETASWSGRDSRIILSFNGGGVPPAGGTGTATVEVDGSVISTIDVRAGGIRPWTYIVETGSLASAGTIDVKVRADASSSPVVVRSIVFETDNTGGPSAGNTLDEAYDQGGPGLGRTINTDAGAVQINGVGGLNVGWRLGIQTSTPDAPLEILGLDERSLLMNGDLEVTNDDGYVGAYLDNTGLLQLGETADPNAQGRIELYANGGGSPGIRLDAATQTMHVTAIEPTGGASQGIFTKGDINLLRTSGIPSVIVDSDVGLVQAFDAAGNVRVQLNGTSGETTTDVLHITGGADLAEPFPIEAPAPLDPGTVVVIDPRTPGSLVESAIAYDRRVAGVISGAGGVNAGLTLGQRDRLGEGQDVALTGRVYVKATAGPHPIVPGDLLTTSDLPGHAMAAVDHDRSHGAIIGKAMTGLETGTGLVLVLVNLQ